MIFSEGMRKKRGQQIEEWKIANENRFLMLWCFQVLLYSHNNNNISTIHMFFTICLLAFCCYKSIHLFEEKNISPAGKNHLLLHSWKSHKWMRKTENPLFFAHFPLKPIEKIKTKINNILNDKWFILYGCEEGLVINLCR